MAEEPDASRGSNEYLVNRAGGSGGAADIEPGVAELEGLPPLSSYADGWTLFWKFSILPAAFILSNLVVFFSLVTFDRYELQNKMYRNGRMYGRMSSSDMTLLMYKANSLVTCIILLIDTFCFFKGAVYMEKALADLEAEEANETSVGSEDSSRHIHAKASRKFDKFLGRYHHRGSSTFVSLLYVATVLSCAGGLGSLGVRIFASTSGAEEHCSQAKIQEAYQKKHAKKIENIPDELQEWAQNFEHQGPMEKPANYIHMSDGTVFFTGSEAKNRTQSNRDYVMDDIYSYSRFDNSFGRVLVSTAKDGSMTKHTHAANPDHFSNIQGDEKSSDVFCCTYREIDDVPKSKDDMYKMMPRRILCVSSSQDYSSGEFPNVTMANTRDARTWHSQRMAAIAHGGELWYAMLWEHHKSNWIARHHNYDDSRERVLEFYKIIPSTMERKSMVNQTGPYRDFGGFMGGDFGTSSICMNWFAGITGVVAALVVFPASYWLLKIKDLPAAMAPVTMASFFILDLFNEDFSLGVGLLTLVASSICLLGGFTFHFLNREMILWGHYSIVIFFSFLNMNDDIPSGFLALVVAAPVGVILNHPVFELGGWVVGIVMPLVSFIVFLTEGSVEGFISGFLSIIVGCGLVSAGRALKKYRVYVAYYSRRMWNAANTPRTRGSNRNANTSGDGLTRGLMDR